GYVAASDYGLTVVLDTALTEELIEEGIERELVSKIQTMRKDAGFEVVDRIKVGYKASDVIAKVIEKNRATISRDVLAVEIKDSLSGYEATWDINGNNVLLSVEKA
ncbi:MAG: isoleucine--tRNA ligase, partial [Clostridia bacterium]|nr:isoleucine--tRNA ligase [Clostridia bacterium]